jgi:hypothetical protein
MLQPGFQGHESSQEESLFFSGGIGRGGERERERGRGEGGGGVAAAIPRREPMIAAGRFGVG